MGIGCDSAKILGIGNIHHLIFLDKARNKRHLVVFIAFIKDGKSACGVDYCALTLNEFKSSKCNSEKIRYDVKDHNPGEVTLDGKTHSVNLINDSYIVTVRMTNSLIKRALKRGKKVTKEINGILNGGSKGFLVRPQGLSPDGSKLIMHFFPESPKYSVMYFPENSGIGLFDKSLNSRDAFPCSRVVVIETDDYDKVLKRLSNYKDCSLEKPIGFFKKLISFFKR